MDISPFKSHYRGFFIDTPQGNNAFSFRERSLKKIFVPPLIDSAVDDVSIGEEVAFSEVVDGREVNAKGLRAFVHVERPGRDIFVFDNHNHAFFFWCAAALSGHLPKGLPLVHVDQHKDTREPERYLEPGVLGTGRSTLDCSNVFEYTNYTLNVGNFIPPALKLGIFSRVIHVASREAFDLEWPDRFVLDIDLDVFAPVMSPISDDLKVERLRDWAEKASFVTIATSPFFVEQARAIGFLKRILIPKPGQR